MAQDRADEALRLLERKLPRLSDPKTASEAYVVQGDALVSLGQVTDAFRAYQNAMQADPDDTTPKRKTAELLMATGNSEKALIFTDPLAAAHPLDAEILALHGAALAGAGDFKGAESVYRNAAAVSPTNAAISISLAELLLRQGRDDDARQVLLKATETSKSPEPWLALGRLDEQQGNPLAAEIAYRRAVQAADTEQTNFRLAQFLQRAAKINEAQVVLNHLDQLNHNAVAGADFSLKLGKATSALEGYVRALQAPEGKNVRDEQAVISRAVEAALYEKDQSAPDRLRNARVLLAQNASRVQEGTRALLETEIALAGSDLTAAARDSQRALAYQPRSAAAHYLRGIVLDMQGEENAANEWEEAVRLDDHIPSRMLLAQTALRRGELNKAQEHIATVVREEPANLQALLIYGRVLERAADFDAAQSIVSRALIIDPASVEGNVIAGNIAMQRGLKGAAFISYEKALLFDGRSAEGIAGLLKVFAQGRPNRVSIAKIERMAAAPPESAMLYEVAGRLYEIIGSRKDAQRLLHRSLELDAHRPTARLALWRSGGDSTLVAPEAQKATVLDYEHAVTSGDQTGVAANNLAFVYAVREMRLDRALELSLDAVRRMPAKPEPMDTLGFVFLKMRRYTAAADAFERALQLSPETAAKRQILLHLADAYQASGEDQKAASARAEAKRLRS